MSCTPNTLVVSKTPITLPGGPKFRRSPLSKLFSFEAHSSMKNTLNFYFIFYNWGSITGTLLSTSSRLYIGYFGILLFPLVALSTAVYVTGFLMAPPVDIDGIREPVAGSLLYGNNIISGPLVPSSNAIGVHFYPIWEAKSYYEWLNLLAMHGFSGSQHYISPAGD